MLLVVGLDFGSGDDGSVGSDASCRQLVLAARGGFIVSFVYV